MPRADGLIQVLLEQRKWCQWVPGRSPTTTRSSLVEVTEVEDFLICINCRTWASTFCFLHLQTLQLPVGRAWPDRIHRTHNSTFCVMQQRVFYVTFIELGSTPTPLDGGKKKLDKILYQSSKKPHSLCE